jgi:hypothetical protein
MPNQIKDIIRQLEQQKAAIERALSALRDVDDTGNATVSNEPPAPTRGRRGTRKHTLSSEARERIAAAQRARWAKQKRATKKQAKKLA